MCLSWCKAGATTQPGRGRASRSTRAPRPVPATWPDPAPGNWVGREATGGRRLQKDYAPVSRNLSKWTGQAGPLRAGVIEAAAPTPARPRTAGESGPAAKRGWLAPRLQEERVRPGSRDGKQLSPFPPLPPDAHTRAKTGQMSPVAPPTTGHTYRATHVTRA